MEDKVDSVAIPVIEEELKLQRREVETGRVVSILDQSGGSVDFEEREQDRRGQGWAGYQGQQATGAGSSAFGATGERAATTNEEHIPIVEEQLRVGKREVNRGTARVRSYVEEVPVHETVNLREEHVNIERHPVDQSLSSADLDKSALFQDRTIEVTETAEEAVLAKEARVKEEVVVSKTATEHTEEINDTVRRTNVDIDRGTGVDRGTDTDRGGFFDDKNR